MAIAIPMKRGGGSVESITGLAIGFPSSRLAAESAGNDTVISRDLLRCPGTDGEGQTGGSD